MDNCKLIFDKRKNRGWSQAYLAEKAQCSIKTISNLENGKNIKSGILFRVLDELGLSIVVTERESK